MAPKFRRPDAQSLSAFLDREPASPTGAILRLAWRQGLTREEICRLTWEAVHFDRDLLALEDREVPLHADTRQCLERRWDLYRTRSPFVILSDRDKTPLTPESVSRLARRAFQAMGQPELKLMDLRHDFILRELAVHDWPYVARISGMTVGTLQSTFLPELDARPLPQQEEKKPLDEFSLWRLMQRERTSPAGLALWLTWQMGLREQDIIALTWDQVDLETGELLQNEERIPLTSALCRILEEVHSRRSPEDDPHILLTPRSGRPLDKAYLSKLVRTALIRGGVEDLTLRDLRRGLREDQETALLHLAERQRSLSRAEAAEFLAVQEPAAYGVLKKLTDRGKLVRVGKRYYPAGSIVPPERHQEEVCRYIAAEGFAYRQDIAKLLGLQDRQCTVLLKSMVSAEQLVQEKKKYFLKQG